MIRVASYCRVSTDHEDQVNSFASQQRYFREYIAQHAEWELYRIYADEGITGTSTKKRTSFLRMIQDAHEGKFQLILTKEISRFSRNILDTITYTRALKAIGVGVLFMTENLNTLNPESEMLLTFMGTIAQEESRRTSVRVKWGQTRRMEQGVVFGPSLLGYDVRGGKITKEPEGAELVKLIFHKYGVEKKGTSVICKELRAAGFRTPTGNLNWSASQIIKILKNEKYVGDLVQKKTITPDYLSHEKRKNRGEERLIILRDHHEGIVDRELWNAVQEELAGRSRRRGGGKTGCSGQYAFSGKIICGMCSSGFVSRNKRRKDGSIIRRWGCSKAISEGSIRREDEAGNATGCDVGWLLRNDAAMGMVRVGMQNLMLDRESVTRNVVRTVREAVQAGATGNESELKRAERELAQLEKKKIKAMDAYFSGEISENEMTGLRSQYENRTEELRERLKEAAERMEDQNELEDKVEQIAAELLSGERESEILYKTLVQKITVFKARYTRLSFYHLPQIFVFAECDKTETGAKIENGKDMCYPDR